ncbi:MAG: hypothetical protein ACKOA9_04015, partial [Actinomycetota bacterium]
TSWSVHDTVALEALEKPAVVVVTEEFVTIAKRIATLKGHASLRTLVLPYPLETRPDAECRAIAHEFYPLLLDLLGVTR